MAFYFHILLIIHSVLSNISERSSASATYIVFKKAYDSVRGEDLYNILTEFVIPMELVRLIKMCLTVTYNRVLVGKNLSDTFPITNGLKQGDVLSPLLFNFA